MKRTVRAVIVKDCHLLVAAVPDKPYRFLPGGRLEDGETLEQALIRELREELLLTECSLESYLGQIQHSWREGNTLKQNYQDFFKVSAGGLSPAEIPHPCESDGIYFEWLPLEPAIAPVLRPPSLFSLLQRYLGGDRGIWAAQDCDF